MLVYDSSEPQGGSSKPFQPEFRKPIQSASKSQGDTTPNPKAKVVPLLSIIRSQRDRQYGMEWPKKDPKVEDHDQKPKSFKRPLKYLAMEDTKMETKNVTNEHVHYYLNPNVSVLGELILLPTSLIFEPDVDDPVVKERGLIQCQFQYDIKDISNVVMSEPEEMVDLINMKGIQSLGSDFGHNLKGPKFLVLTVVAKDSKEKDIYISINRRASLFFYEKLQGLLTTDGWEKGATSSSMTILPKNHSESIFGKSSISLSTSPISSSLLSVSPSDSPLFKEDRLYDESLPLPKLNAMSSIIQEEDQLRWLASVLPIRYQTSKWSLLFSTEIHGTSINTFYAKTKKKGPTYLILEDEDGFIFGAYISESWECQKGMF